MGSTNKTTGYSLPQWIGSDKPTFLGDFNDAFLKIDTGMTTNKNNASSAKATADQVAEQVDAIDTKADTAVQTANTANQTANAASQTAQTANGNANTALTSVNEINTSLQDNTWTIGICTGFTDGETDLTAGGFQFGINKFTKCVYINGIINFSSDKNNGDIICKLPSNIPIPTNTHGWNNFMIGKRTSTTGNFDGTYRIQVATDGYMKVLEGFTAPFRGYFFGIYPYSAW